MEITEANNTTQLIAKTRCSFFWLRKKCSVAGISDQAPTFG